MDDIEYSPRFAEYFFNTSSGTDCFVRARGNGNGDIELIFLPQLGYPSISLVAADARILIASLEAALVVSHQIDKLKESA